MTHEQKSLAIDFLSKSSPSQLQPFQLNRSRTQPSLPSEAFFASSQQQQQKTALQNNNLKLSNLSHVPCKFFRQGTCTAGANCTFSHSSDLASEASVCKYFVKGNCKFGTKCALLHTMSPYGTNKRNLPNMIIGTPPVPSSFQQQMLGRRKTAEYSSSLDPFATSAPALFHDQVWRRNDMIGLSPRDTALSSSFSGGGLFENSGSYRQQVLSSGSLSNNNEDFFANDLNDAMLPSSLNDLFTPTELNVRRARQQQQDEWNRVPFLTKSSQSDYMTGAINIPNSSSASSNSNTNSLPTKSYLLQQPMIHEDDDVQFFMEDDEAYDNTTKTSYQFPSLVSLPTTSS